MPGSLRMMMVIVDSSAREELEVLLRKAGAPGFTELAPATGWGETGFHLGSGAFPKTSTVLFSILEASSEERVRVALAGFEEGKPQRVRAYAWTVEEVG